MRWPSLFYKHTYEITICAKRKNTQLTRATRVCIYRIIVLPVFLISTFEQFDQLRVKQESSVSRNQLFFAVCLHYTIVVGLGRFVQRK